MDRALIAPERATLLPAAAIACSAVLWGLWWLPLRGLAELGLSGPAANAALYGTAALALAPLGWLRRRQLRRGGFLLLGAGGVFGLALVCWNLALLTGQVVRVTLLFYLAPVWATLLALAVLGDRAGPLRVVSILLGIGGAAVLLGFEDGLPLPRSMGDWLGLATGVLFAVSVTLVRKGRDIDGRDQTLVAFTTAALLSVAMLLVWPIAEGPALPAFGWAAVASLAWLLPLTWLLLWGAGHLDPGRVSLLLLLEVVVAAVSATLIAGEPLGLREAAGCVLIMSAGALEAGAELRRHRRLSASRA